MHGDSILDFYNALVIQNDVNYWIGYLYATGWVLFSLTIIYNITISIVQEVMAVEEYKLAHHTKDNQPLPSFIQLLNDMSIIRRTKPE